MIGEDTWTRAGSANPRTKETHPETHIKVRDYFFSLETGLCIETTTLSGRNVTVSGQARVQLPLSKTLRRPPHRPSMFKTISGVTNTRIEVWEWWLPEGDEDE